MTIAAVAAFTLAGCVTAVTPPAAPTEADATMLFEEMLAKSWVSTGLSESMERPTVVVENPLTEAEWLLFVSTCMEEKGFPPSQNLYDPHHGYRIVDDPASVPVSTDPVAQLEFFRCIATHPFDASEASFLTAEQLNFIYDYYQDMIFPCLARNGLSPHLALSRERFLAEEGDWSPYRQVWNETNPRIYTELIDLCGPETPELD